MIFTKLFSKKLIAIALLVLPVLAFSQQATQQISGPATALTSAPSTSIAIPVSYNVSNGDLTTTGLGLRLHFNSSQLTFNNNSSVFSRNLTANETSGTADVDDFDGDTNTDMFVNVAWASQSREFPGTAPIIVDGAIVNVTLPLTVLTANFTTSASFSGTTVNFTSSSNDTDFAFTATSVVINDLPSAVATLSALSINGATLSPLFSSNVLQYTASVFNASSSLVVSSTPTDSNASVVVAGNTGLVVGANTVTVTVTAEDGTSNQVYTIIVTRAAGPTVTISGAAITVANVASYSVTGACSTNGQTVTVSIGGIAASANCASQAWTVSGINVSSLPDGNVTLTADHSDGQGSNATQATATVVKDVTAPVVTAPAAITMEATGAMTTVALGTATAQDNVDGAISTVTPSPAGPFSVGSTTVTWTATDNAGNSGSAIQIVTITDTTGPTVTAPAAVTIAATGPTTSVTAAQLGSATASDLVDGAVSPVIPTINGASATFSLGIGTHTVVWTATDSRGNSGTAQQTVTIENTGRPVVNAPTAITMEATGPNTTVALGTATASDAVDGAITAITITPSGNTFPVGETTVVYSVINSAGTGGSATQIVTITDTTAPTLTVPANITAEANDEMTDVNIGTATAVDLVDGNLVPIASTTGPFPLGATNVIWTVTDSNGNSTNTVQVITVNDTTAPQLTFVANPLTINATGRQSVFVVGDDLGVDADDSLTFTVTLSIDGGSALNLSSNTETVLLTSGAHTLTFTATDSSENTTTRDLIVNVNPLADFAANQVVGAGRNFSLNVSLSGPAAVYPVSIPFVINSASTAVNPADHNAAAGTISIPSGTSGSATFTVTATATDRATIVFGMGTLVNAVPNGTPTHQVTIANTNVAPLANPSITQASMSASVVTIGGGAVLVQANASDANSGQTLTFDWSGSDQAIIAALQSGTDSNAATLQIDPSSLSAGSFNLRLTVSDGSASTTVVRSLLVIAGAAAVADADQNGIPDSTDNNNLPSNIIQSDVSSAETNLVETETGVQLRLGSVALATQDGAAVAFTELPASAQVPATVGDFNTAGDIFDYEASIPEAGSSIRIVLPLRVPTAAFSRVRKYTDANGWTQFTQDANNQLFVAVTTNPQGNCPAVNSAVYETGVVPASGELPAGRFCLQLEIQDGGPNDADGMINGTIVDPVAVQQINGADDSTLSALSVGSALSPTFSTATFVYATTVINSVTSTSISFTVNNSQAASAATFNGTTITSGSSGALNIGANNLVVTVTAADGSTSTYTVTVNRAPRTDSSLAALSVSSGLSPAFATSTFTYTSSVDFVTSSISTSFSANDAQASAAATLNGSAVTSGSGGVLNVGANPLVVTVTAADGNISTYTVTITRADPPASSGGGGRIGWLLLPLLALVLFNRRKRLQS